MGTIAVITGLIYLAAIIAFVFILQDSLKTFKLAKQRIEDLEDALAFATYNNEKMIEHIHMANNNNIVVLENCAVIEDLKKGMVVELNTWAQKRKEYEALIKPVYRGTKKKIRGKRRKR